MKGGLPGGTLGVSSKSELEEAHAHVARWIGSESTAARGGTFGANSTK
jgi:hypothetical protein